MLAAWESLAIGLRHPDVELTTETFGDVWSAYQRRKAAGNVDPMLISLLGMLARQVMLREDGVDDFASACRSGVIG